MHLFTPIDAEESIIAGKDYRNIPELSTLRLLVPVNDYIAKIIKDANNYRYSLLTEQEKSSLKKRGYTNNSIDKTSIYLSHYLLNKYHNCHTDGRLYKDLGLNYKISVTANADGKDLVDWVVLGDKKHIDYTNKKELSTNLDSLVFAKEVQKKVAELWPGYTVDIVYNVYDIQLGVVNVSFTKEAWKTGITTKKKKTSCLNNVVPISIDCTIQTKTNKPVSIEKEKEKATTKNKPNVSTKKSHNKTMAYGNCYYMDMVHIPESKNHQVDISTNKEPELIANVRRMAKFDISPLITKKIWERVVNLTNPIAEKEGEDLLIPNPQFSRCNAVYSNTDPVPKKEHEEPQQNITWYEAVEFCKRLSKLTGRKITLPSVAQLDYCANNEKISKDNYRCTMQFTGDQRAVDRYGQQLKDVDLYSDESRELVKAGRSVTYPKDYVKVIATKTFSSSPSNQSKNILVHPSTMKIGFRIVCLS